MILTTLYHYLNDFFRNGVLTHAPVTCRTEESAPALGPGRSLFEHMTRGRPEIRAQQALYPHLCACYPQTRREWRYQNTFIDFWIPGADGQDVAIELKHYSPHQTRKLATLLGPSKKRHFNLVADYEKPRPAGSVLIQIGLYTAVEDLDRSAPKTYSSVPFVKSYVRRPVPPSRYEPLARDDLRNWSHLSNYVTPAGPATPADFVVPSGPHVFGTQGNMVTGRVPFLLLVAR
ncbi:hypothetical protein [Massilia sp. DD77]|uniref:hypothetical protein n=1 Tax=Massilia sp. DD77 TaxID=3109349 RepID=UPI002FFE2B09